MQNISSKISSWVIARWVRTTHCTLKIQALENLGHDRKQLWPDLKHHVSLKGEYVCRGPKRLTLLLLEHSQNEAKQWTDHDRILLGSVLQLLQHLSHIIMRKVCHMNKTHLKEVSILFSGPSPKGWSMLSLASIWRTSTLVPQTMRYQNWSHSPVDSRKIMMFLQSRLKSINV